MCANFGLNAHNLGNSMILLKIRKSEYNVYICVNKICTRLGEAFFLCKNWSNMNIVAWETKSSPKFLFVKTCKGLTTLKTSSPKDEDESICDGGKNVKKRNRIEIIF